MASSTTLFKLSPKVFSNCIDYLWGCRARYTYLYNIRATLEYNDRMYYRENDRTRDNEINRRLNMIGDASRFRNITVPIVKDQVDTSVASLTSIFCSSTPLFPVIANAQYMDAAKMMDAILDEQARKGRWKSELIKFFRNCEKYSFGACEVTWDKITTAAFDQPSGQNLSKIAKPKNVVWEGNIIKTWDLYNTFWDTVCAPHEIAQYGEYAGNHELITRNKLLQDISKLGDDAIYKNLEEAKSSSTPLNEYYIPQINPEAMANLQTLTSGMNWFEWAGIRDNRDAVAYKGLYIKTTLYIRLIPVDFGMDNVPEKRTPQVWKFIIINFSVVIYAERQTNAHEYIPVLFACPNDDGLKYQVKSTCDDVKPLEQVSSALANAMVAARRRAISDKGIYNPLYIDAKDINNPSPTAKIPLKPIAYAGVDLKNIYMPIPYEDTQAQINMSEINMLSSWADRLVGQNNPARGQFQKGNKTEAEFNTTMENAGAKGAVKALVYEDQFFTPLKYILAINILQFQSSADLFHEETKQLVKVDPLLLRNASLYFKVTDGAVPADKEINADVWQTAMQMFSTNQQIAAEYDVAGVFSYLMAEKGADIKAFEKPPELKAFEQAMTAWQQLILQAIKQNPNLQQNQYPPQPKPQDYGLGQDLKPINPSADNEEESESLIDKILEAKNPGAEQQENQNENQV